MLNHHISCDSDISHSARISHVYYCGRCYEILLITKYPIPTEISRKLSENDCPRCDSPITNFLKHIDYDFHSNIDFWRRSDVSFPSHTSTPLSYTSHNFIKAISLLGLTTHVKFVDNLIGGLQPGWFTIFYGSMLCHTLAERLCVKAQLSEDFGGWQSTAVFVDGGNSFDPYLFTDIAREYHLPIKGALDKIIISRSFTPYQLHHSIKTEFPKVLDKYGAKFAVVSNIFHMFVDNMLDDERNRIICNIARSIKEICRNKNVSILVTCWRRKEDLENLFFPKSDVLVEFKDNKNSIEVSLLKHPRREQVVIRQEISEETCNQMLLRPLEGTVRG